MRKRRAGCFLWVGLSPNRPTPPPDDDGRAARRGVRGLCPAARWRREGGGADVPRPAVQSVRARRRRRGRGGCGGGAGAPSRPPARHGRARAHAPDALPDARRAPGRQPACRRPRRARRRRPRGLRDAGRGRPARVPARPQPPSRRRRPRTRPRSCRRTRWGPEWLRAGSEPHEVQSVASSSPSRSTMATLHPEPPHHDGLASRSSGSRVNWAPRGDSNSNATIHSTTKGCPPRPRTGWYDKNTSPPGSTASRFIVLTGGSPPTVAVVRSSKSGGCGVWLQTAM